MLKPKMKSFACTFRNAEIETIHEFVCVCVCMFTRNILNDAAYMKCVRISEANKNEKKENETVKKKML